METQAQQHERLIRQFLTLRQSIILRQKMNDIKSDYLALLNIDLKVFIENEIMENGLDLPSNVYYALLKENRELGLKED